MKKNKEIKKIIAHIENFLATYKYHMSDRFPSETGKVYFTLIEDHPEGIISIENVEDDTLELQHSLGSRKKARVSRIAHCKKDKKFAKQIRERLKVCIGEL